jgi:transcriptional regulator with XRE-family HTH domain
MASSPDGADGPWLWSGASAGASTPASAGQVLQTYRAAHGLTQAQLADMLSIDQSYISKVESGRREIRDVRVLLRIARRLAISPRQLGLALDAPAPDAGAGEVRHREAVVASQHRWRLVRQYLNRHRAELARRALSLYHEARQVATTTLIAAPGWLPAAPVVLGDIGLRWRGEHGRRAITGAEPEARLVCPLRSPGSQFSRYTSAIRYLDRPVLFENRPSYRLLDLSWSASGGGELAFGLSTYFEKLDVSEALGHELASAQMLARDSPPADPGAVWRHLPFRALVGDPFDLHRRSVLPAITTLTLRRSPSSAAFLLHWRDPDRVATAGGLYDVMPAGEFQPSTVAPLDHLNDFDIWRNVVREFSEEFLGAPEHDGSAGTPIDYEGWALYRSLGRALEEGRLHAFCLGVGLDALTLAATILTVVVIEDETFEDIFGDVVRSNAEGFTVTAGRQRRAADGVPFTEANVTRLLTSEPMASPGAACLALAWHHRSLLLSA